MNTLKIFFVIENLLSLMPSYHHPVTRFQKIATCLVVTLNFVITMVSIKVTVDDPQYNFHKKVLFFLSDTNLLIVTCYTPLSVVFWNRDNWQKLIDNLKFIVSISNDCSKISRYVQIAIARLFLELVMVLLVCAYWTKVYGLHFVKYYSIHCFQYWLVYSYSIFVDVILYILSLQYKCLNNTLSTSISTLCDNTLNKIEQNYCFLKEFVDIFNEVFQWITALIICYTVLYMLHTLDFVVANLLQLEYYMEMIVLVDVLLVVITVIGTLVVILWCDSILTEAGKLVRESYGLQRKCRLLPEARFERFTKILQQNFPSFSAAGFFEIKKSTCLGIINTVTTFFIVAVQFRTSE
ncbi:hypothetical protein Zmor_019050 [Zophobas morio]|uniref:Gustatory receptor n=1 Tax=Zophobas morio TaxID=2755281 RepID=A0AA38IFG6_9CUCU|nr:hypothetical protein Zmor_019050 [Zophobas morio]